MVGCSGGGRASVCVFFFQAEDGIRDLTVTGVQTCALPISRARGQPWSNSASAGYKTRARARPWLDRKSTRLNSSHSQISYAVFCLKKKKKTYNNSSAVPTNVIITFGALLA